MLNTAEPRCLFSVSTPALEPPVQRLSLICTYQFTFSQNMPRHGLQQSLLV